MNEVIANTLTYVTIPALLGSILLGFMVGAFYGFQMLGPRPPAYPFSLWLVGIAFVVFLGVYNTLEQQAGLGFALGRGFLWTVTCLAIPIGRWSRLHLEAWRVERKTRRIKARNGTG